MGDDGQQDACAYTIPMRQWIEEPDPEMCRSCTLGLLINWYKSELEENERQDLVAQLEQVAEDPELQPKQVAEVLDTIKVNAGEPLGTRLREFDCTIQVTADNIGKEA